MLSSKITRNFQITLPKEVRDCLDCKIGENILFVVEGNCITLSKKSTDPMAAVYGLWKDTKETGLEYERRMRRSWKKRY